MGRKGPKYDLHDGIAGMSFEQRIQWAFEVAEVRELPPRVAYVLLIMAATPGQTQEQIGLRIGLSQTRVGAAMGVLLDESLLKINEGY